MIYRPKIVRFRNKMIQNNYSYESSGAFVKNFTLNPYNNGCLDELTFAVKDNIDIEGQ